jgi:hypothetical protein
MPEGTRLSDNIGYLALAIPETFWPLPSLLPS